VESSDSNAKSVLIIEDERPLGHALELKLGHSGFITKVASNGNEALNALREKKYDVLLLDLILPELDGFALLKEIRTLDEQVKIIILSNLGQDEDRERVAPYNISEYYVKSNTPLAAVVNSVQTISQA
jgi:DNA-binding response OmpR family regulator